jgi:hypothetical protein
MNFLAGCNATVYSQCVNRLAARFLRFQSSRSRWANKRFQIIIRASFVICSIMFLAPEDGSLSPSSSKMHRLELISIATDLRRCYNEFALRDVNFAWILPSPSLNLFHGRFVQQALRFNARSFRHFLF